MSLRTLTAFVVLVELIVLGVFAAALFAYVATAGGRVTIDMTLYGERWVEYWLLVALVATAPYALYVTFEEWSRESAR